MKKVKEKLSMCFSNYHCQSPSYFQNPFCWTLQVSSSKAPTIWNDFKQATTAHKGSWIPSTMNDMFMSTAAHFKWQNAGTSIQQSHNVIAPLPIALIKIVPMPSTPHFTCCNIMAFQDLASCWKLFKASSIVPHFTYMSTKLFPTRTSDLHPFLMVCSWYTCPFLLQLH